MLWHPFGDVSFKIHLSYFCKNNFSFVRIVHHVWFEIHLSIAFMPNLSSLWVTHHAWFEIHLSPTYMPNFSCFWDILFLLHRLKLVFIIGMLSFFIQLLFTSNRMHNMWKIRLYEIIWNYMMWDYMIWYMIVLFTIQYTIYVFHLWFVLIRDFLLL